MYILSYEILIPGRCLSAVLDFGGERIRIINCYAPADKRERKEFFETLRMYLTGRMAAVVVGDLRSCSDRKGLAGGRSLDVSSRALNDLILDFWLRDEASVMEGSDPTQHVLC